jgi:transcriptional regulator with XRE-family HTH domain
MTMQPEQLKDLRKSARLTIAEMAEAIGMSLDSVGRMERGVPGYPIEGRTQLAVQTVAAYRIACWNDPGEREGDIPLEEAQIIWADAEDNIVPPVAVRSIDRQHRGDERYANSNGACCAGWKEAGGLGRLIRLFALVQDMTLSAKLDPRAVHDALIVIPEYRSIMPSDPALGLQRDEYL